MEIFLWLTLRSLSCAEYFGTAGIFIELHILFKIEILNFFCIYFKALVSVKLNSQICTILAKIFMQPKQYHNQISHTLVNLFFDNIASWIYQYITYTYVVNMHLNHIVSQRFHCEIVASKKLNNPLPFFSNKTTSYKHNKFKMIWCNIRKYSLIFH